MKKLICHMTHIDNLNTIISSGGLAAKNKLKTDSYKDIANLDVQDKRSKVSVILGLGGTLHDYVPFYFSGATPMLYVNKWQQDDIIFLVSDTETIVKAGVEFVFTDRHAVVKWARFYSDIAKLAELDWKAIKEKDWGRNKEPHEYPEAREKKQAEFLVHHKLAWEHIVGIAVCNEKSLVAVKTILQNISHKPEVKIKSEWYFL